MKLLEPACIPPKNSPITVANASFSWPDGTPALAAITGTFNPGRTGLVGRNGSGKSTLLRLIAGDLPPAAGQISTSGDVGYLPQNLTLDVDATVAGLLGVDQKLAALRAIESGDVAERHFDVLGDDWDIEAQAEESLRHIGLTADDLVRPVAQLSGGEVMLVAIAGLRLQRNPITLLDEPTNNLDRQARSTLYDLVASWTGTLVVVSHDTALLELMEHTAELHAGRLSVFGGPYSAWRRHLDSEQAAAIQAERTAAQAVKTEKRQRIEAETKLARRARTAQTNYDNKRAPRIAMNQWASNAEVSAAKLRMAAEGDVRAAQAALDTAAARIRDDEHIHLDLPDPQVARSRRIAELSGANRTFVIQGPERIALTGPNGSGKTTLLENLLHGHPTEPGQASGRLFTDRVGYLPQRLDSFSDSESALEVVGAAAPALSPGTVRNNLARLLLRGGSVHRPVRTLSGGERFRVALARLLFADPPAQLLVLDEPTNNLDLGSVDQLVEALRGYRGAVLVVSHDDGFLARLGLDMVLELDHDGALDEAELPEPSAGSAKG